MTQNIHLDDLIHYSHRFLYTVQTLPKDGGILFISRGAPEPFLYNKHYSWKILSERVLLCDSKGRLGLVIGPTTFSKLGLIMFSANCRGAWSVNTGIFTVNKPRMIEICTIRDVTKDVKGRDRESLKTYIGCTKVLVDNMLIPELSYVPKEV